MQIVVTGATGFVGSHLVRALVQDQHEVVALVRSSSSLARVEDLLHKVTLLEVDAAQTWKTLAGSEADALIHVATDYGRDDPSPSRLIESNVLFPLRACETLRRRNPLIINTDSFFSKPELNNQYLPAYTTSKRQLVDWLKFLASQGARVVNLRLEHVFGPGDAPTKFVPSILERLVGGEERIALSEGRQTRDFIFIEDVVSAYQTILGRAKDVVPGFTEHQAGRGEEISVREFVELMKEELGSKSRLEFGAIPAKAGEIQRSCANIRSLQALGWRPKIELAEGIRQCIVTNQTQGR